MWGPITCVKGGAFWLFPPLSPRVIPSAFIVFLISINLTKCLNLGIATLLRGCRMLLRYSRVNPKYRIDRSLNTNDVRIYYLVVPHFMQSHSVNRTSRSSHAQQHFFSISISHSMLWFRHFLQLFSVLRTEIELPIADVKYFVIGRMTQMQIWGARFFNPSS